MQGSRKSIWSTGDAQRNTSGVFVFCCKNTGGLLVLGGVWVGVSLLGTECCFGMFFVLCCYALLCAFH